MRARSGWQFGNKINDREGLAWDGESALAMATKGGSTTARAIWRVHITRCMLDMRQYVASRISTKFLSALCLTTFPRQYIHFRISHQPADHTSLKLKTMQTGFTVCSMEYDRTARIQKSSKQLLRCVCRQRMTTLVNACVTTEWRLGSIKQ